MSTIVTSSHAVYCLSNPKVPAIEKTKRAMRIGTSFIVHRDTDGKLHADTQIVDSVSPDIMRAFELKEIDLLKEWRAAGTQEWKDKGATVFDCDQCKHRLACLVSPEYKQVFESR